MSTIGIIAILTLLYWLYITFDVHKGIHLLHTLPKSTKLPDKPPLVSVIIAAKEEERTILETVQHLLSQNYPRLEIIAVNDRSQDATGVRLEELRKWSQHKTDIHTPLQIIHITHLPEGWLGKNHALYQGYQQARGQYLLFTDADIIFAPGTISDAVTYMKEHDVQHLTLTPNMIVRGALLQGFVHFFLFSFSLFVRPWRANDDNARGQGIGIGAFNMVSRSAYEAIGTHKAIALRPDDDLQLGIFLKRAGFRQKVLSGKHILQVEWYRSLKEAIVGLEKNLFSGFRYSYAIALLACLGQLVFFITPWLGLAFLWDWRGAIYAVVVLLQIWLYRKLMSRLMSKRGDEAYLLPISASLLLYTIARSVWLTWKQGGIYWRGTFYSLRELKKK
ncbi:Glycosyltransferase, catalytic subunit of cellulose synthase and poly-beta-1,6-N-acetylglucosamine synthase [Paenibacillus sp. yr247]|uniref:glycosyltransferase n=1 Tax=Paenibacillus sp. yr247 TaxID=1761880 RepID=UPI000881EE2B|nr:glycosyltransferase family 2 protein [Paenibacillus sp. yr247]SDO90492.1 Glycosyltransferase, catalytic subunit of cellulose synthase and poly-beta-1,6-N-acetylglucosamine synthase [Paenibacillus sp. yr247]